MATAAVAERSAFLSWYQRNRRRSQALFDLLTDEAYYHQPIDLRHPIVFYDGHLPGFSFNTLIKKGLGEPSIDARLEDLFARGIDPDEPVDPSAAPFEWPSREAVRRFTREADRRVVEALTHAELDREGHPLLDGAEAVYSILEHEAMHHETLLYMWHRLPLTEKRRPEGYQLVTEGPASKEEWIAVPAGRATLGVNRGDIEFAWDNECPAHSEDVPGFEMNRYDVTNAQFMDFVDAGGYGDSAWWTPEDLEWIQRERVEHPSFWDRSGGAWHWRGMFDSVPLPLSWPVYVALAEARAYAKWRGLRLPTEAEFQRAAYGDPSGVERPQAWGAGDPAGEHGVFDLSSWDPHPVGSHPAGRSAWGFDDLVGNGWEWTTTPFAPFDGFRVWESYPEYSADFFDGQHFVIKGASPATARELIRPTFRNWFRPRYPYVYATFRCVRVAGRS
jgi:ergothioneine biosynthesis protein EgtB